MDTLELYRWAVQDPETQVSVLQLMFDHLRPGRSATVLREDFAGTSAESVAWVTLRPGRRALAIDVDGTTLDWARRRAERILGPRAREVQFITDDVMAVAPPAVATADLIPVLNFSICYFRERARLLAYLRHAHRCLADHGLLVLNVFGGPAALRAHTDSHAITPTPRLRGEAPIPPFQYHWEQRGLDAVDNRLDCRIHFSVPDPDRPGETLEIRDAFCYDWRLWSLPELRELLLEAGFADAQVWRHTYDPDRGADGVFLGPVDSMPDLESWVAYVVGIR